MDDLEQHSDWDLIASCKQRDDHAWKELVKRHERSVRFSIREKLGDKAKDIPFVEDMTQEIFVALIEEEYKRLGLLRPGARLFRHVLESLGHTSNPAVAWPRRHADRARGSAAWP